MTSDSDRLLLVAKVVGQVLFLFGLLAWLDGVVIQLTNPMWLAMPVSHLLNVRTDTFTILMFITSAIGFFIWRLAAEFIKYEQNKATH
ncbi:MAG: hypothetical protein ABSD42_11375 [Candidatus Bathyarchaeia archaeon]|jgi:hypothetical protein